MTQDPIIVDITEPPENVAQEVLDLMVGSFGLAGLIFVAATALGLLVAMFLYWRKSKADGPVSLTRDT